MTDKKTILFARSVPGNDNPVAWAESDEEVENLKEQIEGYADDSAMIESFHIGELPHVEEFLGDKE